MVTVIAVEFSPHGILHYLDVGDADYRPGDYVLYPTENGGEVCRVVWGPTAITVADDAVIPTCLGLAAALDLERDRTNRAVRAEAEQVARELIRHHDLPMRIVGVDYVDRSDDFDRQVAIYFQAPQRVDFRALITDLARSLHARIDLRQVASRDAARLIGGIGRCGRELCCTTFLNEIEPVSMRLARVQGLPANPMQISGACGRLLCCLHYEQRAYIDFARQAPSVGERVRTATDHTSGVVVGHNVPSESVDVRVESGEVVRCPLSEVCVQRPQLSLHPKPKPRPKPRAQSQQSQQQQPQATPKSRLKPRWGARTKEEESHDESR